MKNTYITIGGRALSALTAMSLVLTPGILEAASSWNPTLLVNTESFQTIDQGDGSTNIELRFGQDLGEKLEYDVGNQVFDFSRGLKVRGDLTSTGSLSVKNVISGAILHIDSNADIDGTFDVAGESTLNGGLTVDGDTKFQGNLSGTSLNVDDNATIGGSLSAVNALSTQDGLTINSDNDSNDATLTFGNVSGAQTLKFVDGLQRFELSKDLFVNGDLTVTGSLSVKNVISGAILHIDSNADIDGTFDVAGESTLNGGLTVTGNTKVRGNLSGTSLNVDDNANIGGTLGVTGATNLSDSLTVGGDAKVRGNLSGATLNVDGAAALKDSLDVTGAATLNNTLTVTGDTKVRGNLSGTSLNVDDNATIGGSLSAVNALSTQDGLTINSDNDSNDATLTFGNVSGAQTLKFVDGLQRFELSKDLFVNGNLTVSGHVAASELRVSNFTVSGALVYTSGSTLLATNKGSSGQLLISYDEGTPRWKTPLSAMVWYLDAGLSTGTSQGPVITMPFGFTVASVSLRSKIAPTGAAIIVDILKDGSTIFSTKPQIAASATTGGGGAVLSTTELPGGSVMSVNLDQVGSVLTGSGLTIMLNGTRKY